MAMEAIVAYVLFINVTSITYMYADKQKAIKGQWRVSEKTFFGLAIFGGSIGVIIGMKAFRHKTKHPTFKIGMPFILIIQIALISYYF